ncbi:MAG: hypothetical protein BWY06_01867 [Candidatus Latescibacteria bacterium ADurb.Bin168]|nr:MAG: hypothetical protein BWY06_01867 [Candidatus Latescibacteria bacterium ADurb.Bin168]
MLLPGLTFSSVSTTYIRYENRVGSIRANVSVHAVVDWMAMVFTRSLDVVTALLVARRISYLLKSVSAFCVHERVAWCCELDVMGLSVTGAGSSSTRISSSHQPSACLL